MKFDIVFHLVRGFKLFVISFLASFISMFVATILGVGTILSVLSNGSIPTVSLGLGLVLIVLFVNFLLLSLIYDLFFKKK